MKRVNSTNREPFDRYFKRQMLKLEKALAEIEYLRRQNDQILKFLLRREVRNTKRWDEWLEEWDDYKKEQQKRWDESRKHWDENEMRWDENQKRWDTNQEVIQLILRRIEHK